MRIINTFIWRYANSPNKVTSHLRKVIMAHAPSAIRKGIDSNKNA